MADIYVNHTGSSTAPYDTEAKAATDIQVALDAAGNGDTVWIKADQDYVMDGVDQQAAKFDVDVSSGIKIKGYYSSTGDQDYGGAYYKDATNGWGVIDANDGSYPVFDAGDFENISIANIKTINVNTGQYAFDISPTGLARGWMFQNIWTTGGREAFDFSYISGGIIRDGKFTGSYSADARFGVIYFKNNCRGGLVEDCNIEIANAGRCISNSADGVIVRNNIMVFTATVSVGIHSSYPIFVIGNVMYKKSGTTTDAILLTSSAFGSVVYNNIIANCTDSIDDSAGAAFGGWNCLYNNGSDWTLREGDIQSDPQFMDAANGDFRLKPTSPCLNAGKPTPGSGYTSIGAWQRKSFLR